MSDDAGPGDTTHVTGGTGSLPAENGPGPETEAEIEVEIEPEIEMVVVTMTFDAVANDTENAALLAVLSKYIVLSRMEDGCRNIDLCSSHTVAGRHLIVQKWDSDEAQRAHFDSALMVEMAQSCRGLLASAPDIDLWEATSAHDLR